MEDEQHFFDIFLETFPALLISGLFAIIPGFFLTLYADQLSFIIGLITFIPAIIGMRGNVFGSFCAHLSTLYHIKQSNIKNNDDNDSIDNNDSIDDIYIERNYNNIESARQTAAMTEVIILSILLPVFGYIIFVFFQKPIASFHLLLFICISSGISSGLLLLFVSILTIYQVRNYGLDPDNIAPPLVTTLGDVLTLPIISLSSGIGLSLEYKALWAGNILGIIIMIILMYKTYSKESSIFYSTIIQRIPVLFCCLILSSLAGLVMEEYFLTKISASYLFFIPLINAQGGNSGSIFASRISTSITIKKQSLKEYSNFNLVMNKERFIELGSVTLSMICVFLFIGIIVNILGTEHTWMILILFFFLSLFLGFFSQLIAISISLLSLILQLNPDNIVIAFVCAFMDLLGTYCYAMLILLFFGIYE